MDRRVRNLYETKDMKKMAKFWINNKQPKLLDKILQSAITKKNKEENLNFLNEIKSYMCDTDEECISIYQKYIDINSTFE